MASELKNLSIYSETGIAKQTANTNFKIGIAVSEWNQGITANLAEAAIDTLKKYGFTDQNILLKSVPGSFELAQAAQYMIKIAKVDAVICLGCVIQGETRHFDYVCSGITQGIMNVNLETGVPVAFGILTTDNRQQALDRAGGKHGNKGIEATVAALKMLQIKNDLTKSAKI
ncbi:MAG: 6,7-dimethyl-8-ribityllumazine synthase [Bacteroidales bacterium]|nr:6,7-dimethyl-8-ribityllumazine synthase [Bacteroidales bacterium]MDD4216780.1 6,7-dimethyl-8-ribityllumazine synthase [Bacteroidales bacterium]MDY0142075.1 6,7-dimethyl-8-ribityllumazine synthase [Bacteroidales bacterium]